MPRKQTPRPSAANTSDADWREREIRAHDAEVARRAALPPATPAEIERAVLWAVRTRSAEAMPRLAGARADRGAASALAMIRAAGPDDGGLPLRVLTSYARTRLEREGRAVPVGRAGDLQIRDAARAMADRGLLRVERDVHVPGLGGSGWRDDVFHLTARAAERRTGAYGPLPHFESPRGLPDQPIGDADFLRRIADLLRGVAAGMRGRTGAALTYGDAAGGGRFLAGLPYLAEGKRWPVAWPMMREALTHAVELAVARHVGAAELMALVESGERAELARADVEAAERCARQGAADVEAAEAAQRPGGAAVREDAFVGADFLWQAHGIRPQRLSQAATDRHIRTRAAAPGTTATDGRAVRKLYSQSDAIRHFALTPAKRPARSKLRS